MVKGDAMRILVLCDDQWHPAATVRAGLAPLEDNGFSFDFLEDAHEWSAELMNAYPVVLLTKSNQVSSSDHTPWVDDVAATAFVKYVRNGRGLVALHSGSAGYREQAILRGLLGGVFDQHPPQCPVTFSPRPDHSLCVGVAPFEAMDEHYHMLLDDAGADVFATTLSAHGTQPGGWTRREGAGRVCVLTPGHNLPVWLQPAYQSLIGNALRWACGPG